MGERELALGMSRIALRACGVPVERAEAVVQSVGADGGDGEPA